jgi:hypothetical protein
MFKALHFKKKIIDYNLNFLESIQNTTVVKLKYSLIVVHIHDNTFLGMLVS